MDDMISRQVARREQFGNSEHQDCSDCVNHGGDWDCDHVHCRKGTDTISRQAAIDALGEEPLVWHDDDAGEVAERNQWRRDVVAIKALPSAQPGWIPFKTRPLTEEEKEEHPEWDCILDCKLPDDGQAILVSIDVRGHERVQYDEYYSDDGSYLDSGYEIGTEAVAWMPLPEPYRGDEK